MSTKPTTVQPAPAAVTLTALQTTPPAPVAVPPQRERVTIGLPSLQLNHAPIPGYHLSWVDEWDIERFQAGGYEFVEEPASGDPVDRQGGADITGRKRRLVGMNPRDPSSPRYQFLMKIRDEWHEENLEAIREQDRKLQGVLTRKSMPDNLGGEGGNFYHPKL
jgi:hypothetical protein